MITDRDKLILKHLEKYKFATIGQLEKIFFKDQQYSYNIVRRRLGEMKRAGYVKVFKDIENNRNIYIWNDSGIKPPNLHRIILLDVLAEMYYQGYNVELFNIERNWNEGKVRSDAFAIFTINNRRYHFFVEVHLSNNHCNLEKYDTLYKTNEVQTYLGKDFFPRILLISDRDYSAYKLNYAKWLQLDTRLKQFSSILL